MVQYVCPECGGNIRTLGLKAGTLVFCRHCGAKSTTKEDNVPEEAKP